MKKRSIIFLFFFLFMSLSTTEVSASEMDFSAHAVIPENQQDKTKTYFNLRMNPGERQKIKLLVSNSSDKETTLAIQPNTAMTNRNGVIDYSQSGKEKDSTLVYNFADLVTGENEITLNAGESREVEYEIVMPDKMFEGVILGGFYVRKVEKENDDSSQKNVQIKNVYSIVIAASLTESDKAIGSELKLNGVQPGLENYRTVVTATIQNIKPKIEDNMTVSATISKEGTSKVLHRTVKEDMRMAPNSNFDFPIDWDQQELKPGKYTANIEVTTTGGKWAFSENFTIQKKNAKKLNSEAVDLKVEQNDTSIFLWIIAGLLIIISFLLVRNTKKGKNKSERLSYDERREEDEKD